MSTRVRSFAVCLAVLAVLAATRHAQARPQYFEIFTTRYDIASGDRLYACGVCHLKWTGTGGRNPFGTAVEQQLYVGKQINQALQDIEGDDADVDGFTNVDEIVNYLTLPGYSCTNFYDAIGAPVGFDTYITPMVASCLEPLDIRVSPTSVSVLANAGDVVVETVTIHNNGSTDPLNVSSYALVAGTHAAFSISGPATPVQIPVGSSIAVDVVFAPAAGALATGTLRITSDDPDEGTLDVPLAGIGVNRVLAPAEDRAACLKSVDSAFRRYAKTHLQQWSRCYGDEIAGRACDAGVRDVKIGKAAARLRAKVGGTADRRCAGAGLKPFPLGFDNTCGGGCGDIVLSNMSAFADCLVCRQEEVTRAALVASSGTMPPDVPASVGAEAAACGRRLVDKLGSSVGGVQKLLGRCEIGNITAATPVDCAATYATDLAAVRARIDAQVGRCGDTTGLGGCLFGVGADPACLGTTATTLGTTLVDATVPR
jgi:hypothetical protein